MIISLSNFYVVLDQYTSWLKQVRRFYNNLITIDLFWPLKMQSLVDGTNIPKLTVSSFLSGLVLTCLRTQQVTLKYRYWATKQNYVTFLQKCLYNNLHKNLKVPFITVMRTSNVFISPPYEFRVTCISLGAFTRSNRSASSIHKVSWWRGDRNNFSWYYSLAVTNLLLTNYQSTN